MRGSILGLRASAITASQTLQLPRSARALSFIQGSGNGSSSGGGSKSKSSDEEGENTEKGADVAEERLQELLQTVRSDAYVKMLGTPLRRCAVSRSVLPKALMFSMTSHRPLEERTAEDDDDDAFMLASKKVAKEPPNALLRRRSLRWRKKEAKRSTHKTLLRSERMLLHKIVTSQTDKSRAHFTDQLQNVKQRLERLLRPPPTGQLLPFGLTRASVSRGGPRGKSVWCMLNKRIVSQLPSRNAHRTVARTSAAPSDLVARVQDGLEERVLEEAQLFLHRAIQTPRLEAVRLGWLVRRMRGPEVRQVLDSGLVALRDDERTPLACLLVSGGEVQLQEPAVEVFHLDRLFLTEHRSEAFKQIIRNVAERFRIKAGKGQRLTAIEKKRQREEAKGAPESPAPPSPNSGKKWPRIRALKRDERTADLCIALWRLQSWCQS